MHAKLSVIRRLFRYPNSIMAMRRKSRLRCCSRGGWRSDHVLGVASVVGACGIYFFSKSIVAFGTALGISVVVIVIRAYACKPRQKRFLPLYKGTDHRGDLRGLIAQGKVPALAELLGSGVHEKVDLVVGICAVAEGVLDEFESECVAYVFTCTLVLEELHRLKRSLDARLRLVHCRQCRCLYDLIYSVVLHKHRAPIIAHFEAVSSRASVLSASLKGDVIILSDIDDTLVSTFKDWRFPFATVYPGVKQFYHELVLFARSSSGGDRLCNVDSEADSEDARGKVVFVTARPPCLDSCTTQTLDKRGFPNAVVLRGKILGFVSKRHMLQNKIEQCKRMHKLFPESRIVLNGDNGQTDVELGQELLRLQLVDAVFIHNLYPTQSYSNVTKQHTGTAKSSTVSPESADMLIDSTSEDFDLERQSLGVAFYETCVGAAHEAFTRKLLDAQGVTNIAQASVTEMEGISFRKSKDKAGRMLALRWDISRFKQELELQPSQKHDVIEVLDYCINRLRTRL